MLGQKPIHYAAKSDQIKVVKYLITVINEKEPKDKAGNTPLSLATSNTGYGAEDLVNFLKSYYKSVNDCKLYDDEKLIEVCMHNVNSQINY